ncbi:MAG: mRNA surveillance protein pelota [Candidatus Altiarchaeota archaeon]
MKVFYRDYKQNLVKLRVESIDDLWYLSQIIQPRDLVKAPTVRRIKEKSDMGRSDGGERKKITLVIEVEKTEYANQNVLRILGTISQGPEDLTPIGSHHALIIEPGTELSIKKEGWTKLEKQRLDDAEKASLKPKLLIVVVDEGEATLGLIRESGSSYIDLRKNIGGKEYLEGREKRKEEFYKELAETIVNQVSKESLKGFILAGCGFEKNSFHDYLKEKNPELAKKGVVENIGSYGQNGVLEVLKRPITKKFSEELSAAQDATLIDELLTHIGKESGLAAYGLTHVSKASSLSAIKTLLISTKYLLENRNTLESLIDGVKKQKGTIHFLNSELDSGAQLDSLGGLAAILRFRIE